MGRVVCWEHISKNVPGQEFNGTNHCHFTSAKSGTITPRCACLAFCFKMLTIFLCIDKY